MVHPLSAQIDRKNDVWVLSNANGSGGNPFVDTTFPLGNSSGGQSGHKRDI